MRINSREKGKRGERYFKQRLINIFPNIRRNANEQSQMGGVDLLECEPFDFEVKIGEICKSRKIRLWIDQVESEGNPSNFKTVLVKPDDEKPYAIIPLDDFLNILELMKNEGIIKS